MALERLQKIIAAAGIASRRKAEELIQQGLVVVNGKTVTELGTKADPDTDSIRVNDKLLKGPERHEYLALNKPRGYVTTVSDPEGRPTVMELVRSKARLYPIGRLDFNSEGLLLFTNDGALAHKLMKAASHIPKTYLVKVAGQPKEQDLRRLRAGVSVAEERDPGKRVRTSPALIRVIKEAENPWLEVTLHEGRNRQIRKMFEEVGHHVEKIRRVRYGPLELDVPPGESRILTAKEVAQLQHAVEPGAQPRFATQSREPRLQKKPGNGSQRPEFRPRVRGERQEKKDWKKKPSFERKEQTDGARPQRFGRREASADRQGQDSRFKPREAGEGRPESFSRSRDSSRSRAEFGRQGRPKFKSQFSRNERSSSTKRFEGRPNRQQRSKSRDGDKRRPSGRFRER
jgi:23S rRNA pseudouridine2605 synthase